MHFIPTKPCLKITTLEFKQFWNAEYLRNDKAAWYRSNNWICTWMPVSENNSGPLWPRSLMSRRLLKVLTSATRGHRQPIVTVTFLLFSYRCSLITTRLYTVGLTSWRAAFWGNELPYGLLELFTSKVNVKQTVQTGLLVRLWQILLHDLAAKWGLFWERKERINFI